MAVKLFVGGLAFATSSGRLRETLATMGQLDGRALRLELSQKKEPSGGGGR